MGNVCWDFPLLGTGNQSGNNIAAIEMFKGSGIMDGLAREICQNSLDAKNRDLSEDTPVRVKFELVEIAKTDFPMFDGYKEALESSIAYWKASPLSTSKIMEFLYNVEAALAKESIPMLVMSDYNTNGLNGVNASANEQSFWNLLVNTEGISIKQDDRSAGSFGIGKNAPFAYSALNLVFYNTLAKDGGRAFEGVTRLVTTQKEYKGTMRPTQPIGKYLYLEDEYTGRPILPCDNCAIANIDAFSRTEIGTDVAVVGFKTDEYSGWEKLLAIAIIKNFILAIMDGRLEVVVKSSNVEYVIRDNTVEKLLFADFAEELQLKPTRQIFKTRTEGQRKDVKIADEGDLSIFVKYDDSYDSKLARFRSTGMLINTDSNAVFPHFSVVIVVNDVGTMDLSKTLRDAEPPQHTEWKASNITDNAPLRKKASKYIREIAKAIQNVLNEFESTEASDKIDAGIGSFLPDASDSGTTDKGGDGLRTDVAIKGIQSNDGRVLYNKQAESATSSIGKKIPGKGTKTGPSHHEPQPKPPKKKKIPVVEPGGGKVKGVAPGPGKVKISTPVISAQRTFYVTGNKYRCYANSSKDYDRVFIRFYAHRDDGKRDLLCVKNVKPEGEPRFDVHGDKIGPVKLHQGNNVFYVEFENSEIMAVTPEFVMEVKQTK